MKVLRQKIVSLITGSSHRSLQVFEGLTIQVIELLNIKGPGQLSLKKFRPRGSLRVDHKHDEKRSEFHL